MNTETRFKMSWHFIILYSQQTDVISQNFLLQFSSWHTVGLFTISWAEAIKSSKAERVLACQRMISWKCWKIGAEEHKTWIHRICEQFWHFCAKGTLADKILTVPNVLWNSVSYSPGVKLPSHSRRSGEVALFTDTCWSPKSNWKPHTSFSVLHLGVNIKKTKNMVGRRKDVIKEGKKNTRWGALQSGKWIQISWFFKNHNKTVRWYHTQWYSSER